MSTNRRRVLHIITGLEAGGAELSLLKLCQGLKEFEHIVVSLAGQGGLEPKVIDSGARVINFDLRSLSGILGFPWRLRRVLRDEEPTLVQGWMYHGDAAASVARFWCPSIPVVWNVRHSTLSQSDPFLTRVIRKGLAHLSSWVPRAIVANGISVMNTHAAVGYDSTKFVHIPNGYDQNRLVPSEDVRRVVRSGLGLQDGDIAVGLVGKFVKGKGIYDIINAFPRVVESYPSARLVLVGRDLGPSNHELEHMLLVRGIRDSTLLLGHLQEPLRIYRALDLLVSASKSEGFPNSVAEAATSGLLVLATDVGDTRQIIADPHFLVASGDPETLSARIVSALGLSHSRKQEAIRANASWMRRKYSETKMLARYQDLYLSLIKEG